MSKKYEVTEVLQITIHSSNTLLVLLLTLHFLALLAVILSLPFVGILISSIFIGVHGYLVIRHQALKTPAHTYIKCQVVTPTLWKLTTRVGKSTMVKLTGCYRSRWMVGLFFTTLTLNKKIKLVIFYDSIPSQQFDRLLKHLWSISR